MYYSTATLFSKCDLWFLCSVRLCLMVVLVPVQSPTQRKLCLQRLFSASRGQNYMFCESHPLCFAAASQGMCRKASALKGYAVRNVFMQQHSSWGFGGWVGRALLADTGEGEVTPTEHLSARQDFSKRGPAWESFTAAVLKKKESQSHCSAHKLIQIWKH